MLDAMARRESDCDRLAAAAVMLAVSLGYSPGEVIVSGLAFTANHRCSLCGCAGDGASLLTVAVGVGEGGGRSARI